MHRRKLSKNRRAAADQPIKIGVSSCLLGEKSRYNSGHKLNHYIIDVLGRHFQFVPICPELDIGMDVPREAVRLEGTTDSPRLVGVTSGADWTDRMNRYSQKRVRQSDLADICGYILKKKSPSCGMERVQVYGHKGAPRRSGVGLYASALMIRFPYLPVEEEGRLNDPVLRENFIVRIFACYRLKRLFGRPFSRKRIIAFHTANKYLLLAHDPEKYRQLGRLLADIENHTPAEFKQQYRALFMGALGYKATVKKNVTVLRQIIGLLKNSLTTDEKRDVLMAIADYHCELVPLIVPMILIRHFVSKYRVDDIRNQVYLSPHPKELMLRNHV